MSDATSDLNQGDAPQAQVKEKSGISLVWLLPAIAVLLGGWLLFKSIRDRGVTIEVTFETADGLEAGKTAVRFRDVQVGIVDTIRVAKSRDHVVAAIVIDREAKDMLSGKTQFWVVRPRATLQGISGLGTLLSGAYIAIDPSGAESGGDDQRKFTGLEEPPVLDRDTPGARFVLTSDSLGSMSIGSPIYFRGIGVGEVTKYELDDDAKGVTLEIFVNDPHHHLVTNNSRFWNASGIDVRAGADGLEIDTASLEAMLVGGIEFDSPATGGDTTAAADGAEFKLYSRRGDIEFDTPDADRYVCFFSESLRGLAVQAPVEFRGIPVGHVEAIDVHREAAGDIHLPVTISIQPERFNLPATLGVDEMNQTVDNAIQYGLRAKLGRGSLITGSLFVDLVIDDSAPPRIVESSASKLKQIPTIEGGLAAIEATVENVMKKLESILDKVDELPMGELVQNASDAAASLDRLASSPDLEEAIQSARKVLDDLQPAIEEMRTLMTDADAGIQSAVEQLTLTTEQLRETLAQADKTMASLDESVGPDSATMVEVTRALSETSRAARSLRELTSFLKRHPESLLRGKSNNGGK